MRHKNYGFDEVAEEMRKYMQICDTWYVEQFEFQFNERPLYVNGIDGSMNFLDYGNSLPPTLTVRLRGVGRRRYAPSEPSRNYEQQRQLPEQQRQLPPNRKLLEGPK